MAVLPSRLKFEMEALAKALTAGEDIAENETLAKHVQWVDSFRDRYTFTAENAEEILRSEIGKTFEGVLEDAGVFKCDDAGRAAFMKFIGSI